MSEHCGGGNEIIGKAFVKTLYPDAKLEWIDGRYVIVYYDGSDLCDLGEGKNPEEAWHDAAIECQDWSL